MKRHHGFLFLFSWLVLLLAVTLRPQPVFSAEPPARAAPSLLDEPVPKLPWPPELAAKIEPYLLKQALQAEPGSQHRFVVELVQQADLTPLPPHLDEAENQHQVVASLQATAQQSQAGLLAFLQPRQASGQAQEIIPFWIFNGLAVTADADTLLALATRPEVRFIREDRWRAWVDTPPSPEGTPHPSENDMEWNIARVRADLAWSALGLDGSGVTVAIMDTGVDWLHPALQDQYRGYKENGPGLHLGNWFCTSDEGYLYPVDGHGHGTHVAGIAVGGQDSSGRSIGIAPGTSWIAVKMLNDGGYGYDSWIHAAFEWVMAPAGDPALAPDIVNGSWSSRFSQDDAFRGDLQALRAAGIVAVFANGNYGPNPETVGSPASYPEAFAVGATDDIDAVIDMSSRGPSPWDEFKPEVVAPGAQVRSSLPGGTYGAHSGTSMAAPHVTGQAALLLQADPSLTIDDIEALITSTAVPMGDPVPNNDSGWGLIDVYQAAAVALKAGFVGGQVVSAFDQQPIPSAQIAATDHTGELQARVETDELGRYRIALVPDRYDLHFEAFGYGARVVPEVPVETGITTTLGIVLAPLPTGTLQGQISNAETSDPVGAHLYVVDTPAHTSSDADTGDYDLALPAGTYVIQVAQNGFRRHTSAGIEILAGQATQLDIALTPAPTLRLVDSGRWYHESQIGFLEQALEDNDLVFDLWEIRDLTTDLPTLDTLSAYDVTIWSSPADAPGLIGAGDVISDYLGTGGRLLLTGQDVGFWDDGLSAFTYHSYYRQFLKTKALYDDAGRSDVVGEPDEILHDLILPMNGPDSAGNQGAPDLVELRTGRHAASISSYADGGVSGSRASGCQSYRAAYLAAGLEGLGDQASRAEVIDRAVAWLTTPHPATEAELFPHEQDEVWFTGTSVTYTVELRNMGQTDDQFRLELYGSTWPATTWDGTFSKHIDQSNILTPCHTQTLGIRVDIPPGVTWNVTNVVTLTVRSQNYPFTTDQARFYTKAPAPILLVDDHRWYDTLDAYRAALEALHLPYDVWAAESSPPHPLAPTWQRFQRYPIVIWFTAYDWYRTLTPEDEALLASYLEGGGRLLLSSQDYLYTSGFTDFARHYLGVADYTESMTVTRTAGAINSPVGLGVGPLELIYPFRNFSDALRPSTETEMAFWGQHGQPVALQRAQPPWKTAFYAYPLEAFVPQDMATVMSQTVDWLSPLGESSLLVDQPVVGEGDHLAYTLEIRNTGQNLLSSVLLSNTVPPGTTYVVGSLTGPAIYDPATDRFTWHGILAPGQQVSITYDLQVDSPLPDNTLVRNVVHLLDQSGLPLYRVADSRVNAPNLSPSKKSAGGGSSFIGQVLTYTLVLQNEGLRATQAQLVDPIPAHTAYLSGSAQASSGLLTSTAEALFWSGPLSSGHVVTITFPVKIELGAAGLYIYNRASLEDAWGNSQPLEAYVTAESRIFLPLVLKQP